MLSPFAPGEAWSLFASDPVARVDAPRWDAQAGTFFDASLALVQRITDPAGVLPSHAGFELDLRPVNPAYGGAATRVAVRTLPLAEAPALRAAALRGVEALGGAGMDALVAKATRLWQVRALPVGGGDPRAPLVVAALLASVLLAPIVPPGEATIFGVRGARLRLMDQGWPRVR